MFYLSALWDAGEVVERIAGDFKGFLVVKHLKHENGYVKVYLSFSWPVTYTDNM